MINDLRKAIFRLALTKRYYSNGILDPKVLDSNMNMLQQKLLDSNMRFEHGIELISKSKNIDSEVLVEFVKRHKTHPKLLSNFLPMLDGFKHKYNANFLNLLIGQAAVRNLKEDVLRVYMKYDELNIARDHYTYTKLVSYASRTNDLELCKLLNNELKNLSNPKLEPILYLLLMEVFASRDKWDEVEELHKFIKDCDRNLDYANILMNAVFASDNIMTKYYNLYWQNVKKENFNLMIILLKRFRATNNRPLFFKTFEKAKEHKFTIPQNVYAHCLHLFGETDKLFNYYLEIREDPKIQPLFFSTVIKCVAETKRYEIIDYLCKDFRRRNDLLTDSHVIKALEILSSDKNVNLPADIAQNTDTDLDTEIFNLLNETEEDKVNNITKDIESALSKFYHMLKNGKIPNKTSCVLLLSHLSRDPEKHSEFKKVFKVFEDQKYDYSPPVYVILFSVFGRSKDLVSTKNTFEKFIKAFKTGHYSVLCAAMHSFLLCQDHESVLKVFEEIKNRQLNIDKVVVNYIFTSIFKSNPDEVVEQVEYYHEQFLKLNLNKQDLSYETVKFYFASGHFEEAWALYGDNFIHDSQYLEFGVLMLRKKRKFEFFERFLAITNGDFKGISLKSFLDLKKMGRSLGIDTNYFKR